VNGIEYGKGSDVHKASVVGDTVGDPFKDTSGPSLNILLKLMSVVALVIAPSIAMNLENSDDIKKDKIENVKNNYTPKKNDVITTKGRKSVTTTITTTEINDDGETITTTKTVVKDKAENKKLKIKN